MDTDYTIGQVFEEDYPPEVAEWCNQGNGYIAEIEKEGETRRFQIMAMPALTQAETIQAQINAKLAYLNETDWYAVRYAETGTAIPEDVAATRATYREEISTLREQLAALEAD